jgi:hypothetical protein
LTCNDAPILLKMRRTIAADLTANPATRKNIMANIDQMRWNHEKESPKCECWQNARREADKPRAATPLRRLLDDLHAARLQ